MFKFKYNIGDKVGKCVYLGESNPIKTKNQNVRACIFKCSLCDKEFRAIFSRVKEESVISCGCYAKNVFGKRQLTHGKTKTSEFKTWQGMIQRCYNPKNNRYAQYGGRGIIVCDRWLNSFENFFADMGVKPTPKHTLDRIRVNENYESLNCRWLENIEQQNNKRNNVIITYKSKTMTLPQWSREIGIGQATLRRRINNGWDLSNCLTKNKFLFGGIKKDFTIPINT